MNWKLKNRKRLSVLLVLALVITGLNVTMAPASKADAQETAKDYFTVDFSVDSEKPVNEKNTSGIKVSINGKEENVNQFYATTESGNIDGGIFYLPATLAAIMGSYTSPAYRISYLSEGSQLKLWDLVFKNSFIIDGDTYFMSGSEISSDQFIGEELLLDVKDYTEKVSWQPENSSFLGFQLPLGAKTTIEIYDAAKYPGGPTTTEDPVEAQKNENHAFLRFADKEGQWKNIKTRVSGGRGKDAVITGNGTYTVSLDKDDFADIENLGAANGVRIFDVDIKGICHTQKFDASQMAVTDVIVKCDGDEIPVNLSKMYEGNIVRANDYRLEIRDKYGYQKGDFTTKVQFDRANPSFIFEKTLAVTFTIQGIKDGKTPEDAFTTSDGDRVVAVGGDRAKALEALATETPLPSSTNTPLLTPTAKPGETPMVSSSELPTEKPSETPKVTPSETPTAKPSETPKVTPSETPTAKPSETSKVTPSETPTAKPSETPKVTPSETPTAKPSETPKVTPSETPTAKPSETPKVTPGETPTAKPSETPEATPGETPQPTPGSTGTVTETPKSDTAGSQIDSGKTENPIPTETPVSSDNNQEQDTYLPDEDDEEDDEDEKSNPIKKITAPKQIVVKKGKSKTVIIKLQSKIKSKKTTDEISVVVTGKKKAKISGRKYNSKRLTFTVKGKKKGNTTIYVIIGEKSRKINLICI